MPLGEGFRRMTPASRLKPLSSLMVCMSLWLLPSASTAKPRTQAALNPEYVAALSAADRFLQAWQSNDTENGVALLTSGAKNVATTDGIDRFFSNPAPSAYEIGRGKLVKQGRYEFPVVLVLSASDRSRVRRRFSTVVMVNTGSNDWAVDKLP
jgi:hypothetical protein